MPGLCIPKSTLEKLKAAFRDGEISIEKLYDMTSEERHTLFKHYIGEDFARLVNSDFEKAILSQQKDAFNKFVEKTFTPKQKDLRSAFVKKLEKIDKVMDQTEVEDFLGDLANTKLGMKDVSEAEISTMLEMKKNFEDLESQIPENAPDNSAESLAYGFARNEFNKFVGKLKERTTPLTAKELLYNKVTHPLEVLTDIGNVAKSALSTLDDSFFGRQGLGELFSPFTGGTKRWVTNFTKSFKDIGKQLVAKTEGKGIWSKPNDAVMDAIHAEILGSKNARNGKYAAARNGYGLGVNGEEAFPSTLIERVPGIGRFFKASEVAFNGGALRMRKALADSLIERAEKNGVDVMDKNEASALGELTTIMTGRAELGKVGAVAKELNALAFSPRFLWSNVKKLIAPIELGVKVLAGDKEGLFAKKQAAINTLQIIGSIATIMTIANTLHPGSAETDPRATNFGKLKINGHTIDITGGLGSLAVLAARMVPDKKGKTWEINSLGKKTQTNSGKFGVPTRLDEVVNFFEGKLSPLAGVIRDELKGKNYQGQIPTPLGTIQNIVTPISIQNQEQLKNPDIADRLLVAIFDGLGFNTSTPTKSKPKKK